MKDVLYSLSLPECPIQPDRNMKWQSALHLPVTRILGQEKCSTRLRAGTRPPCVLLWLSSEREL